MLAIILAIFDINFCLVGHSHVPLIFQQNKDNNCFVARILDTISLGYEDHRLNYGY